MFHITCTFEPKKTCFYIFLFLFSYAKLHRTNFLVQRSNILSHELNYLAARNNDHGRSDDVILVQIAGDVQVAILGVSVAKQPAGLPRRFETLSEREPVVVVAIPAPESRYVPSPKLLQSRSFNTIINESLTNKKTK